MSILEPNNIFIPNNVSLTTARATPPTYTHIHMQPYIHTYIYKYMHAYAYT